MKKATADIKYLQRHLKDPTGGKIQPSPKAKVETATHPCRKLHIAEGVSLLQFSVNEVLRIDLHVVG